jgi:hypothetical protein
MGYKIPQDFLEELDDLQVLRTDAQILFGHNLLNARQPAKNCPEWWTNAAMYVRETKRSYGKQGKDISAWYDATFERVYDHNLIGYEKLFQEPPDKSFHDFVISIRYALTCIRKMALCITNSEESTKDLSVYERMVIQTSTNETTREELEPLVNTFNDRFRYFHNGDSKDFLEKVVGEIEVMTSVLKEVGVLG